MPFITEEDREAIRLIKQNYKADQLDIEAVRDEFSNRTLSFMRGLATQLSELAAPAAKTHAVDRLALFLSRHEARRTKIQAAKSRQGQRRSDIEAVIRPYIT